MNHSFIQKFFLIALIAFNPLFVSAKNSNFIFDFIEKLTIDASKNAYLNGNFNPEGLADGVYLLLETDLDFAIEHAIARHSQRFRHLLRTNKIRYLGIKRAQDHLIIHFKTDENKNSAQKKLAQSYPEEIEVVNQKTPKGAALKISLTNSSIEQIKAKALQRNITILENRLSEIGISKVVIKQQGASKIEIQLLGKTDLKKAKKIFGISAMIEFHLVDESLDPFGKKIPRGSKRYKERDGNPIFLKRRIMISGADIVKANPSLDAIDQPSITFQLSDKGAKIFSKATRKNIRKLMAVVLITHKAVSEKQENGSLKKKIEITEQVISVARIQEKLGKYFQITGLASTKEAYEIALLIRTGALSAPVYIVEEHTIGEKP